MDAPDETVQTRPACPGSSPFGGLDLRHVGVLAALPGELGSFLPGADGERGASTASWLGIDVHKRAIPGASRQVSCVVSGVGKVAAAHAAAALIATGIDALFVVGTCGGLKREHAVGDFIHLLGAVQWDLSVREGREVTAHRDLSMAWQRETAGQLGWALTADRPALGWVARARRARAASGLLAPVADMETAAVGAIANRAGVPWAAMRVISDAQRSFAASILGRKRGASSFKANYGTHAARPAQTLWEWLSTVEEP